MTLKLVIFFIALLATFGFIISIFANLTGGVVALRPEIKSAKFSYSAAWIFAFIASLFWTIFISLA